MCEFWQTKARFISFGFSTSISWPSRTRGGLKVRCVCTHRVRGWVIMRWVVPFGESALVGCRRLLITGSGVVVFSLVRDFVH